MSINTSPDDDRIPVRIGDADTAGPGEHVLSAGELPETGAFHRACCVCCVPRGALARTLARLFLARVRGEVPYFDRVVLAGGFEPAALNAALTQDVLVAARFRASL